MNLLNSFAGFLAQIVLGFCTCTIACTVNGVPVEESIQDAGDSALPEHVSLIKPDKSGGSSQISTGNLRFSAVNVDIASLVAEGYGMPLATIENLPSWSKHFDVSIKVVHDEDTKRMTASTRRALLRSVLEERFHIVAHVKTQISDVFFLKPIPALHSHALHLKAAPADEQVSFSSSNTGIKAESMPISVLCAHLTEVLHKSVIDQSGLQGRYDFESSWQSYSVDDTSSEKESRSLKEALREDLGLNLIQGKGLSQRLVIDSIRLPDYD